MTLHSNSNSAFPIQDVLQGNWNESMKTGIELHPIYETIDAAMNSLKSRSRSGNKNGAYVLKIGYSPEQATLLIEEGKLNEIIFSVLNYWDLSLKENNSTHVVKIIKNEHFNSKLLNITPNLIK